MKHLKLFFALFAMLALGVGNAWGADPSVGDVIFQEEFTVTAKTMANAYDFAGTTTWSGSTSGLSYASSSTSSYMETQTANPITSANFFFVKASESNLTMSGISIPSNTTAITVSFQSNKTIVKCTYSFDGTNFSTGATSISGVKTFDIDCTGKSKLYFKFSKTGTGSNARIDNVIVKVKTISSPSATPVDPTATFSNGSYTVGQTLDLSTLWTSNSNGAVTYTIDNAGTTSASISGSLFTATAAGTCTVKASQEATSAYNAIEKTATITVTAPTPATITLSEAGVETSVSGKNVGDSYTLPTASSQTCGDKKFVGWSTVEIATPGDRPTSKFYEPDATVTLAAEQTFYAVYATEEGSGSVLTQVVDVLNRELTGIKDGSSTYSDWNGKIVTSSAVYAGNSAGGNNAIQLRSAADKAASGVITTSSGGKATNITIVWENSTQAGRTLNIYGKNTAYNEVADLRDDSKKGTLIGTIVKGTSTSLTIDEDYEYIALCSNSGAMYLASVSITWTSGGGISYSDYTTSCQAAPEPAVLVSIAANAEGKDEFTEGDAFEKATITATYADETTKDVTSLATFTGYDMNTTGTQTVNVEYEGKTTSYKITVNPKPTYTITWNNAGTTNETKVVQGAALGELPTVTDDCPSGKKFMGWTAATEINSDGSGIVYVEETDIPTSDMTYYAVFAVVTSTGEPVTSYKKVTTISDGTYLIAATNGSSSYAYTGQVTGKTYGGYTNVTISSDEIATKPTDALEVTVKVTDGKFSMHDGTSYLYLSAAAKNELHFTNTEKVDWILDEGKIKNSSITTENRYLQFNSASGSERFACYKSTQKDAFLYKKVTTTPETKSDYSLDCTIHTEPTWTISKDAIDFADKYVGVSYTETFTISASNLTDDIALAIDGSNFTVSPTSIATDAEFPQTVTVTYTPTTVDTHNATLNITSGSTLSKSITLTGSATEATIYTLTALADIKPTDKVIIVGTSGGSTYAMSNDNGTSKAPDAVAVEVADNKIATNETNILWNIAKNGDNLTIYPADQTAKWLYCLADDNNGVRVGTGNAKEFTIDKGYLYTTQTTSARHIGIYNNADWRCYKPSGDAVGGNIAGQSFAFYVLPDTKPSISATPASKDFGVLTVGEIVTQEIKITALNITQELTAELTGEGFTKSEIVDNKITITFAPTAKQEYSATLTISAGTEASASVTLAGEGVAAAYSVTYDKNGAEGDAPTDEAKYVAGSKVTVAGQDDMTKAGYRFAGWKYGEDIYKAGAKFTMPAENVTFVAQWEEKANFSEGFWVLVTDESELATDDYVVIAAADYNVAMKSYESGNNCKQVSVTKANNLLIWNENVGVFQLAKESENYTFQDVNTEQYLYAAGGTSSNYLRAADEIPADENAKKYTWTISIADNKATIKAQIEDNGENKARNTIMYNATEGINGQLFSCYSSGQKAIALYKYVTVPVVELHSGDNSALITVLEGKTVNVKLNRSFTANDGYYTLCVPFDIAASAIGTAYTLGEITEHVSGEEGGIKIYLTSVSKIEAGVPYLVLPKTLTNPVFENVEIVNTTGSDYTITGDGVKVSFTGIINGGGQTNGTTEYYVGDNGYLYNGTVDKLGLRAFFTITNTEGQAVSNLRARVVAQEDEATGVEDITAPEGQVLKVIENGQLIIIRNGEKYNVQGQRL